MRLFSSLVFQRGHIKEPKLPKNNSAFLKQTPWNWELSALYIFTYLVFTENLVCNSVCVCSLPWLQLLRKRHIGNDIVTIVFQEPGALPFTPKSIRSHFQHVFVIVKVHNPCTENVCYRWVSCPWRSMLPELFQQVLFSLNIFVFQLFFLSP